MPSTVIFAELSDEDTTSSNQSSACEYHSKNPNDLHNSCQYKLKCKGLEFTYSGGRSVLEEDYLTQLFLQNNEWGTINTRGQIGSFDIGNPWMIGDDNRHEDKNLSVQMNVCNDITSYSYQNLKLYIMEKGDDGKAILTEEYEQEKNAIRSTVLSGEGKYEIAQRIIDKHPSPKVQMSEFGIPPNKIQCNEGLELFERNNNVPVCLKPQTFEKLMERGFNIEHYST